MANTATFNRAGEQHRRHLASVEVERLTEELKPQLALTESHLAVASDEVLWSHYTNTVVFKLGVYTKRPNGSPFGYMIQTVTWQAGARGTSEILLAIQENLKAIQPGAHDHATYAPR